jgi:hypothetical protein
VLIQEKPFRGYIIKSWRVALLQNGVDVMILKIFPPIKLSKKLSLFSQNIATFKLKIDLNIGV